ncbi:tetratricopeptide repeat protein 36 isoform X1 [Pelecanus crispus]|uniref:tetratricopeptide repeat protein 36 isoform X1 n=1 Tax=Pelecanus crispus TaxID=36300 RepID=UPI003F5CFBB1
MATANDRAVLQTIFNPSTPFGDIPGLDEEEEDNTQEEGEATPCGRREASAGREQPRGRDGGCRVGAGAASRRWLLPRPRAPLCAAAGDAFAPELLEQVRDLELQGVSAAESGDVSTALERFGEAIRLLPERASGYNNRAQALRLRGDVAGALQDLDTAIRLSRGRGRAACQSFVQRGLIHRLQAREDDARRDFERAARLGSTFARRQLVLLNPYSALCNQMLCEMLGRLRNPAGTGSE